MRDFRPDTDARPVGLGGARNGRTRATHASASAGTLLRSIACTSLLRSSGSAVRLIIGDVTATRTRLGVLPSTTPLCTSQRKKAGSSFDERLTPNSTIGPVKAPDAAISNATVAPMLYPATTSAPTSCASSLACRGVALDAVVVRRWRTPCDRAGSPRPSGRPRAPVRPSALRTSRHCTGRREEGAPCGPHLAVPPRGAATPGLPRAQYAAARFAAARERVADSAPARHPTTHRTKRVAAHCRVHDASGLKHTHHPADRRRVPLMCSADRRSGAVRAGRLELPRPCGHQDLNLPAHVQRMSNGLPHGV